MFENLLTLSAIVIFNLTREIREFHGENMYFNDDQTAQLNHLIRKIEQRTGVELVAAVIGKCDSYPEAPWKAFALTVATVSLIHLIQTIARPDWITIWSMQLALVFVLGAGAAVALLSVFWPAFGRLFLNRLRTETEAEQYARALFLEKELFKTRTRTGILILISLFERTVVIVPDSGIAGRLDAKALQAVISQMTPDLRKGDRFQALARGLSALEAGLVQTGFGPSRESDDQIKDTLIEEKGEDR
jgi:putative membrane protein